MDLRHALAGILVLGMGPGCEDFRLLPSFEQAPAIVGDEGAPCYGQALAAGRERLVVSSLTTVFLYERVEAGLWVLEERIPVREDVAGFCIHRPVALSDDYVAFRDGSELRSFALEPTGLVELRSLAIPDIHSLALEDDRLVVVRETGVGADDLEVYERSTTGWLLDQALREPPGQTIANLALHDSQLTLFLQGEVSRVTQVDLDSADANIENAGVGAADPTVPFEGFAFDGEWLLILDERDSILSFRRGLDGAAATYSPDDGSRCGGQFALEGQLAVASRCGEPGDATIFVELGGAWEPLRTLDDPMSDDNWGHVATNGRAIFLAKEVTSVGAAGVFIYED